jgi:hypothetical protein
LVGAAPNPDNGMFEVVKKMRMTRKPRAVGRPVLAKAESQSSRDCSVINIHDIIRAVHLLPKFGKGPTPSRTRHEMLRDTAHYYLNNYIDRYMYNIMYDPNVRTPYLYENNRFHR